MKINATDERLKQDPSAWSFVQTLMAIEADLGLEDDCLYYKFPIYKDSEELASAQFVLVSKSYGVVIAETTDQSRGDVVASISAINENLDTLYGHIHGRFSKNKSLRISKRELKFPLESLIFAEGIRKGDAESLTNALSDVTICEGRQSLAEFFRTIGEGFDDSLDSGLMRDICSVIEGSKGIVVPKVRKTEGLQQRNRANLVNQLEAEIAAFDREQKQGFMEVFEGPQRIRGLAGSGKTVVLAMKAALTHLRQPKAKILYTFYTRSLAQHVKKMITRFYRQFHDEDPNWDNLDIMHAWGGRGKPGVYYNTCVEHEVVPLTYSEASGSGNPFDYVCKELEKTKLRAIYDYVFVDEGQDFPPSFLRICKAIAVNQKFVYAYDELQNIFQADVPSAEAIFGEGFKLQEDIVLKKCYRNPLEILVTAHAVGFGLYGEKIVQMLEDERHWRDLGYEIQDGELVLGASVSIARPVENSPSSISSQQTAIEIIDFKLCSTSTEEIDLVVKLISRDLTLHGLKPEDILVLCADDKYARAYFSNLSAKLFANGIATNNISGSSASGDVFTVENSVTLSSIHRAKGNEGYSVYVLGADALYTRSSVRKRNMAFTALTRAKAWVFATGCGEPAQKFFEEISSARANLPYLRFEYPDEAGLAKIKHDLARSSERDVSEAVVELLEQIDPEELKRIIDKSASRGVRKFNDW